MNPLKLEVLLRPVSFLSLEDAKKIAKAFSEAKPGDTVSINETIFFKIKEE